jgi:hypothetical protein
MFEWITYFKTKLIIFVNHIDDDIVTPYISKQYIKKQHLIDTFNVISCYNPTLVHETINVLPCFIGFNNQPSVITKKQFHYLWNYNDKTHDFGKVRVIRRLLDKSMIHNKTTYSMYKWNKVIEDCLKQNLDDYAIYSEIRRICLGTSLYEDVIPENTEYTEYTTNTSIDVSMSSDERASYLVRKTIQCIPPTCAVEKVLDYGCAEGSITAELGYQLGLSSDCIYGADIRNIPSNGFTFILLPPETKEILPSIANGSIDLITAAMVFKTYYINTWRIDYA